MVSLINFSVSADESPKGGENESQSMPNKDMSPIYQEQRVQNNCSLSSSILYGGQDICAHLQSTPSSVVSVRLHICNTSSMFFKRYT